MASFSRYFTTIEAVAFDCNLITISSLKCSSLYFQFFFCGGDVGDDTRSNLFLLLRLEWFFLMVKKVHLNKNLIKFSLSQNIDFFRSKVTHLTLMNLNKLFKAINLHFFRSYIFFSKFFFFFRLHRLCSEVTN